MKYLKNALILSSIQLLCYNSYAGEVDYKNYNELHQYVTSEAQSLLHQYKNPKPLQAEIFDTGDPTIKSFLEGAANSNSKDLLAMQYFSNLKINSINTSFCFIFYDSKKNIFESYRAAGKMTDEEILQF